MVYGRIEEGSREEEILFFMVHEDALRGMSKEILEGAHI